MNKKWTKKIPPDLLTGSIFGGGYKMKLCAAQNLERYYPPPTAKSTFVKRDFVIESNDWGRCLTATTYWKDSRR